MTWLPLSAQEQNDPSRLVGIGYKSKYYTKFQDRHPSIGWLEIHAENYMIDGGPRKKILKDLHEKFPISCHGVGLSIGSENGLDKDHLARLNILFEWLEPEVFSEHLAWSTHGDHYFNDLLPLPYTETILKRIIDHIDEAQDVLSRQILLENPSSYLIFAKSEIEETEFLREVSKATGCGLLLDVNNVFISANNIGINAQTYIDNFPIEKIQEIHPGGHEKNVEDESDFLLIDSHNHPVANNVWELYNYTISKTGALPTLIEWDADLPKWNVLHNETKIAARYLSELNKLNHVG